MSFGHMIKKFIINLNDKVDDSEVKAWDSSLIGKDAVKEQRHAHGPPGMAATLQPRYQRTTVTIQGTQGLLVVALLPIHREQA